MAKIPGRRARQSTPVFLPGESHGQRSLACCSPWGRRVGPDLAAGQQQDKQAHLGHGREQGPCIPGLYRSVQTPLPPQKDSQKERERLPGERGPLSHSRKNPCGFTQTSKHDTTVSLTASQLPAPAGTLQKKREENNNKTPHHFEQKRQSRKNAQTMITFM